jgi:hypothetical protein
MINTETFRTQYITNMAPNMKVVKFTPFKLFSLLFSTVRSLKEKSPLRAHVGLLIHWGIYVHVALKNSSQACWSSTNSSQACWSSTNSSQACWSSTSYSGHYYHLIVTCPLDIHVHVAEIVFIWHETIINHSLSTQSSKWKFEFTGPNQM